MIEPETREGRRVRRLTQAADHAAGLLAVQDEALEAIARGQPFSDTLAITASAMMRMIGRGAVAFFTLDEVNGRLLLAAESGLPMTAKLTLLNLPVRPNGMAPSRALATGRPSHGALVAGTAFKALALPMQNAEGRWAGVLALVNPPRLPRALLHALTAVAGQIFRISERRMRHDRQMEELLLHDPLTGLPNRRHFEQKLRQQLTEARRGGRPFAVAYLNIDQLRAVNDGLGHEVGDTYLSIVANRLQRGFGGQTFVARLGGDEFAALLLEQTDSLALAAAADAIASITNPLMLGGHRLRPSVSLGLALFPDDGTDSATLMRLADLAMHQAKLQGGNQVVRADPLASKGPGSTLGLEQELEEALEHDSFLLFYQPRIDLRLRRTVAFEALARLRRQDGRIASAGEFIEVLESKSGLRRVFTLWVAEQIARLQRRRAAAGEPLLPISMNLPVAAFDTLPNIAATAETLVAEGLPNGLLRIELVERELLQVTRAQLARISEAAETGLVFELDDFGSAEANFDLLPRLPLLTLKLAGAMTADVASDPNRARLLAAMVSFARTYEVRLCAEQVETHEQLMTLAQLGVQEVQGYYLSRPVSEASLSEAAKRDWPL